MIETLRNAWKVPELRKKILYTLLIIVVFRVGSAIPVPFLDPSVFTDYLTVNQGTIFGYFDLMTGGAFSMGTVFAMSISPYINASIIIQLLGIGIPALERMFKDGEEGRKKQEQIVRYTTVGMGLLQGLGYYMILNNYGAVRNPGFFTALVVIMTFTAGTALLMWLAESVNEKGIGNGISIILFAGIVASLPQMIGTVVNAVSTGAIHWITAIIIAIFALILVGFVVLVTGGERRIPVQYAKRMVGRKMYGGQSSNIPVKVNMTGVLPIIFASSFVTLPATIASFFPAPEEGTFWAGVLNAISTQSLLYAAIYFILIILFTYFYVSVQFNPLEMSNNLKKNGGFVPGIRPGKPTTDFISRIISRITLVGALFLGLMAIIPIIADKFLQIGLAMQGTSLLILVGVALETVQQMESQMLMRHYKGFLE